MTDCAIRTWLADKDSELRRMLHDLDQPNILHILLQVEQIRIDLKAVAKRHDAQCAKCLGQPTYEPMFDSDSDCWPDIDQMHGHREAPRPKSRRELTRCRH